MAYIKNPTEKQKREWAQKARQNEKEAFEMIQKVAEDYKKNPEHVAEFFSFAANFYNYSPNNISLIYSQNPNATFVQSFVDWKKMDTSIVKGAKGIKVLVPQPVTYLKLGEDEYVQLSQATEQQKKLYKNGHIESFQKMHFGIGNVFDISQTTYPKEKYPELFNMGYSSEKHHSITQALISFSENEISCPVAYKDVESIALRGYYVPCEHRIVLNHLMEDTVQLSTLSHELGHALAHYELKLHDRSNSQIEFEGDAISVMLQHNFGIELTEQRKSHLATHFKAFQRECKSMLYEDNPNLTQEELSEKTDALIKESFANVFEIYNLNIDAIEEYVSDELESKGIDIGDSAINDLQLLPRRYGLDEYGNVQRLWNGKTAEQFDGKDIDTFMRETEVLLKGGISEQEQNEQNLKIQNCFKRNGIDTDSFDSLLRKGKFKMDNDFLCTYTSEYVSLDISLNPFLEHNPQVAFSGPFEDVDCLFVTQNQMEFMKELAHERSVLLIEEGTNIDAAIHLFEKHAYKFMEFGIVNDELKFQLRQKTNIPELQHTQIFKHNIQIDI